MMTPVFVIEHRYRPEGPWYPGSGWSFPDRVDEMEHPSIARVRSIVRRARAHDHEYSPGRFHEYQIVKITREVVK